MLCNVSFNYIHIFICILALYDIYHAPDKFKVPVYGAVHSYGVRTLILNCGCTCHQQLHMKINQAKMHVITL